MAKRAHEEVLEHWEKFRWVLLEREARAIAHYYGIGCKPASSYREVGEGLGVSSERIRQLVIGGRHKMRRQALAVEGPQHDLRRMLNNRIRHHRANIRRAEEELDGLYNELHALDRQEQKHG